MEEKTDGRQWEGKKGVMCGCVERSRLPKAWSQWEKQAVWILHALSLQRMHTHQWEQLPCVSDAGLFITTQTLFWPCLCQAEDAGKNVSSMGLHGLKGIRDKWGRLRAVAPQSCHVSSQDLCCRCLLMEEREEAPKAPRPFPPPSVDKEFIGELLRGDHCDIVPLSAGARVTEKAGLHIQHAVRDNLNGWLRACALLGF